jgi:hypothetical protein
MLANSRSTNGDQVMSLLSKAAFAALLLGTTVIAAPAFADDTGCPPGLHRADSEGGQNNAARRADSEGGQNNNAVRRAEAIAPSRTAALAPCK